MLYFFSVCMLSLFGLRFMEWKFVMEKSGRENELRNGERGKFYG